MPDGVRARASILPLLAQPMACSGRYLGTACQSLLCHVAAGLGGDLSLELAFPLVLPPPPIVGPLTPGLP